MTMRSRSLAAPAAGLDAAGCTMGPEYVSPLPPIVASKSYLDNGTKVKAP